MAKALPPYSKSIILFADQFKTLSIYDKTKDTFTSFVLLDKMPPKPPATPNHYIISLNVDVLTVTPATDLSGVTWDADYSFSSNNAAADIWQVADSIVIGMGDIRGMTNAKTVKYLLSKVDLYITSPATNLLRIGYKTKSSPVAGKKKQAKKQSKLVKKKLVSKQNNRK